MKEFKICIKTIDVISVQAETAEAAIKIFESNLKTLVAPIEYYVLDEDEQANTTANS
jgi:hypothetical protein